MLQESCVQPEVIHLGGGLCFCRRTQRYCLRRNQDPTPSLHYCFLAAPCLFLHPLGFPGGSDRKESAYNAGDPGSIPGSGRSPGEGNGYPFQHSCLEDSMNRGGWQHTFFPFPDRQLSKSALWNSGKVKRAEWSLFLTNKKWYTQKGCVPWRAPLGPNPVLILVKHLILDHFLYPLKQIRNLYGIRITLPLLPLTSANRFHHINVFPLFPLFTSSSVASCSGWLNWEGYELFLASGMAVSRSSQSVSGLGFSWRLLTSTKPSCLFVRLRLHHLPISNNLPANTWDVFLKWKRGDFFGGSLVGTLHFHCRGHVFNPWSENQDPACHTEQSKKKKVPAFFLSISIQTLILHASSNPSPHSAAFLINKLSEPLTWVHYYIWMSCFNFMKMTLTCQQY